MVINPWGEIVGELIEEKEDFLITDINLSLVDEVRNKIPVFKDRRPEMYHLSNK